MHEHVGGLRRYAAARTEGGWEGRAWRQALFVSACLTASPHHWLTASLHLNRYVDDEGAIRGLPTNHRASDIALCCGKPLEVSALPLAPRGVVDRRGVGGLPLLHACAGERRCLPGPSAG